MCLSRYLFECPPSLPPPSRSYSLQLFKDPTSANKPDTTWIDTAQKQREGRFPNRKSDVWNSRLNSTDQLLSFSVNQPLVAAVHTKRRNLYRVYLLMFCLLTAVSYGVKRHCLKLWIPIKRLPEAASTAWAEEAGGVWICKSSRDRANSAS
jgi:hypothetical protein